MIDAALSKIRTNLKKAFPTLEREIDNLVGLMFEEVLDGVPDGEAIHNLEQDLIHVLDTRGISYTEKSLKNLLK